MAEHLRAVTLRGPALRQITIFLRRKTQKGFFMEEKTKVTAAPTIAEKCGIKYKEVDGLYYPIFGESEPESYASLGKYGHRYLRALMKNDRYLYNKYFMQGVLLDKAAEYENYAWQLYDTVLQGISKERGIGLERQAVKPTFQANTLVYDGAFYKIGEKRNSVKDSKLADDDYYLLTLAALAKECQAGSIPNGARVVLGVGLPLKQFATVRKQFVKYLKRGNQPVHFKFEDVAYDFTIENVLAFPQCYAAVADRLGSMKGEYLIVDVGSWTIDIMHVKDGVPVESKCETFTESMISVIQEIKSRSSEVFGKEISENVITDYISNFSSNYPEKYARIMDEALEKFVSRVEGILKENGHDTEFTNIIYVGGGAKAMERFGKHGDNISYVTDVRANAKGYEFLAKQMA